MQIMYAVAGGSLISRTFPEPAEPVLPGVTWGAFDHLMTSAWWAGQCWHHTVLGRFSDLRLGRDLVEEVAACLLGGFGMPAEMGLAAYDAVRLEGLLRLDREVEEAELEEVLARPLYWHGKTRYYRFPRQKARYLARCLTQLRDFGEPESDRALRDALATLPGVGLKTASWVVRNYRGSHAVAVLDVHILRACRELGVFPRAWAPQTHYRALEAQFLAFAAAIEVEAGLLDAVMWDHMRRMPKPVEPDLFSAAL